MNWSYFSSRLVGDIQSCDKSQNFEYYYDTQNQPTSHLFLFFLFLSCTDLSLVNIVAFYRPVVSNPNMQLLIKAFKKLFY